METEMLNEIKNAIEILIVNDFLQIVHGILDFLIHSVFDKEMNI